MSTALAKDPDERFPRCRDFAKALTEPVAGASMSDRKAAEETTVASPAPKTTAEPTRGRKPLWARPPLVLAAVMALLLIGTLIFVGVQLSRPRQTPTPPPAASLTPTLAPPPISTAQSPAPTTTAEPTSATPIVGEVPGEPEGAAALRPWVRDLVSLSTAALAAKCWTIAPDSAKRMYSDTTPILNAVRRQGVEGQYGVFWNDETTRVSVRSSEIRSGYACPYVGKVTTGNDLAPNDAEYIVQRYLSRVVGKPVNPDDVESRYGLECNNLSPVARQLLGKVTSFEVNSIRSNGDLEYPVVTVTVNRAGSTRDIHVSLSGGIYGSDDIYCIANSD